jgi:hypothetical protein
MNVLQNQKYISALLDSHVIQDDWSGTVETTWKQLDRRVCLCSELGTMLSFTGPEAVDLVPAVRRLAFRMRVLGSPD